MSEGFSSRNLGGYAVSARSNLRSTASRKSWISSAVAEGFSSRNLGEYAVSARSNLRSTADSLTPDPCVLTADS